MIPGGAKRVTVRIAEVIGKRRVPGREPEPILLGAGECKVRYRDGMIHVGDLKRGVAEALRRLPGSFDLVIHQDDGRALTGGVIALDTDDALVGVWGTVAPHRDPPTNTNRIVIEGGGE